MKRALMVGLVLWGLLYIGNSDCAAQASSADGYADVILLDNGGTVRGKIILRIEDEKVVIETVDHQELEIPWWRIRLISKEDRFEEEKAKLPKTFKRSRPVNFGSNYTLAAGLGMFYGQDSISFSCSILNGVQVDEDYFVGLSTGVEIVNEFVFLPIAIDFRYYLRSGNSYPFLYIDAGYAFGFNSELPDNESGSGLQFTRNGGYGGVVFEIGLGVRTYMGGRTTGLIQVGYRHQGYETPGGMSGSYNLLGVTLGFGLY